MQDCYHRRNQRKELQPTPGVYIGVAEVEDDGVDFNERMNEIHAELATLNAEARIHVTSIANYELTMMYWHIGERINCVVLGNERADYGKQIVATVSRQLQAWYGSKGFEERTIRRMVQFAQKFSDWQIVSSLVSKLSWTHFLTKIVSQVATQLHPRDVLIQQIQNSLEVAKAKWGKEIKEDEA